MLIFYYTFTNDVSYNSVTITVDVVFLLIILYVGCSLLVVIALHLYY